MQRSRQWIRTLGRKPWRTSQLVRKGLARKEISALVRQGALDRIGWGVYQRAGLELDEAQQFRCAALRTGQPSAICLLSALVHYGLADQVPRDVWIMVPARKHLAGKGVKLIRRRRPRWKVGVELREGFRITSLERTLVEGLLYPRLRIPIGTAAVLQALSEKRVSAARLLEMADRLAVRERIRKTIEVLL